MDLFTPLYSLTDRDLETLLIEPYFRRATINLGVGVTEASASFTIPADRVLYLSTVSWTAFAEANTTWTNARLEINPGTPTAHVISSFGSTGGLPFIVSGAPAGQGGSISFDVHLALPPGIGVAGVLSRIGATVAASGRIDITGFLIPPGSIGRGY